MAQDEEQEPRETSPLLRNPDRAEQYSTANGHAGYNDYHTPGAGDQDAESLPLATEPSTKELLATMLAIWIGVFFAALDTTIIATLTAPISSSFDSLSLLSWLASGYLISNAACQPLSGKLTDIFSRRTGLIFSNIFFGVGTLICGLAQSEWMIILGRVIAGVGGGGLTCISTFVTSDLVPLRRRGVWQGYGNLVFGLGMGLGGVVGGWLNDTLSWRWAFLIQVPFIVLSATFTWFLVKIPVKEDTMPLLARIDFLGAILLVVSLVLFLLGLNTGGNQLPWSHPLIIASLVLAFIAFLAFIYVEDRVAAEPVIPVRLVAKTRTVLAACFANWFATMSGFLALYYVPLYLQVRGLSSTQAGLRVIPFAVSASVGSLGTGMIMKATGRYYVLNVIIMAIDIFGAALLCTFDLNSPTWTTFAFTAPLGLAYGGMLTITLVAMISAVEHKDQAVITAASYAFRSTGSTLGITIASAVFQNILTNELRDKYSKMPNSEMVIKAIKDSLDGINHLPDGWKKRVVLGFYMDAFRGAFIAGLGLAVLGALSAILMKEHVLHHNLSRK